MSKTLTAADPSTSQEPLGAVADALNRLRYGTIQLVVHNGQVTQIDVTERQRFGA